MKSATLRWLAWTILSSAYFVPAPWPAALLGWLLIRPVNAMLGVLFGGFNRWFEAMTAVYGRTVARTLR